MGGDLTLSTATLLGFVVTLARVSGVFVFVPLPGMTSGFAIARTLLALSMTIALFPYWPHVSGELSAGLLTVWMISAPFKILLFVLADGWNLVLGSLMKGFYA